MSVVFDILMMVVVLGGMLFGFTTGFMRQALNIAGLFFGMLLASYFYPSYTRWAAHALKAGDSLGRNTLLFFIIFLLIWLLVNAGAYFSFRTTTRFLPASVDRLLGMVLGIVTGLALATLLVLLLQYAVLVPWPSNNALRQSIYDTIRASSVRPFLLSLVPAITGLLKPLLPYGLPGFFTDLR